MSLSTQYAAHVPGGKKDSTTKIVGDDEWNRSLTEAQEITADVPEERITHHQSEVDPKGPTHPDGRLSAKMCLQATPSVE